MEEAVAPSARAAAASAAAAARRLVTSSADPSTATTTNAVPRKMRRPSGSFMPWGPAPGSVAPALLRVRLAPLVEMRRELEPPGVELDRELLHTLRRHLERPGDLGGALVPGVQ